MTKNEVGTWLTDAQTQLRKHGSQSAAVEAQALLAHVLNRSRSELLTHPEIELTKQQLNSANQMLERLIAGEPLPYLTGHQEFFGLDFQVTPQTLIPRPETELLVETAISWLRNHPRCRTAADIGTGSGCIAVTLASCISDLSITATDISQKALEVAARNAARHNVATRIKFIENDLLKGITAQFNLICANLPYIPSDTLQELPVAKHEPLLALDGGADGLEIIRRLLMDIPRCIAKPGLILLEIEASQGQSAQEVAYRLIPQAQVTLLHDLAGLARLVMIEI